MEHEGELFRHWSEVCRNMPSSSLTQRVYREDEIIGQSIAVFFTPEDIESGFPQRKMHYILETGRKQSNARCYLLPEMNRFLLNDVARRPLRATTSGFEMKPRLMVV